MAGRVGRLPLYGLSEGEVRAAPADFAARAVTIDDTLDAWRPVECDYAELLARGGYPEVVSLPDRMRRRWFDGYLTGVVRRDLSELRKEVRPARVESLLRAIAGAQSGELVKSKLADVTAVPASTITSYLDLLADVGLVATVPPWTPNLRKREVGRPKMLVLDSGLALHLTRLTKEQLDELAYREAYGAMLEGLVVAELMRQRTWTGEEFDLYHFRDRNGLEVDAVMELAGGRVVGIEVKAATSFRGSQFDGLRSLRDAVGDRFVAGIVLNTGSESYRFSDRLYGLPIASLWT